MDQHIRYIFILFALALVPACARAGPSGNQARTDADATSPWTVAVADNATPVIHYAGTEVVKADHHFWAANWHYAWAETKLGKPSGPPPGSDLQSVIPFTGAVADMHLKWAGQAQRAGDHIKFVYNLSAERTLSGLTGGGLQFNLDPSAIDGASQPELLDGNLGWRWKVPGGRVRVAFSQPLAELYFEMGDKNTIRCLFVGKTIKAGSRDLTMTITLPAGGRAVPALAERYAKPDPRLWHANTLVWNDWPIDLSHLLDAPAGKRGQVRAVGAAFEFADGSPARFWGCNVQAYALFHGTKQDITRQADRIAALGYNLVRIHHHDSDWVDPNVFGPLSAQSGRLDEASLDRIDWWVAKLKERGVYVWLDLHVGRKFLPADNITGYDELVRTMKGQGKGFNYVNERIEQLMGAFAAAYLGRTNRYTGVRYADEPAVAGVLLTNENDLTTHFGNAMLPDQNNPHHNKLFDRQVRAIAKQMKLDRDEAMRTWEPGASKIVMAEIERRFFDRQIAAVRATGYAGPIACTNFWGGMGLYGLASLTRGDVIDIHSYGKGEALSKDPRRAPNWIDWIACAQVSRKPVTISEWNVEWPTRDRFTAPLYMSAMACFQGWDAPMIYGYVQEPVQQPWESGKWSTWIDPSITALMPAAAVMFRGEHLKQAEAVHKAHYLFAPGAEDWYGRQSDPAHMTALRTLTGAGQLTVLPPDSNELDWDGDSPPDSATVVTDPDHSFVAPDRTSQTNSTGQMTRDWVRGVLEIRTPKSQAACGWIGGGTIDLGDVVLDIVTPACTVAVTSLDDQPIKKSSRILVTAVAQAVAGDGGGVLTLAEPVSGWVTIDTGGRDVVARALSPTGERGVALTVERLENGRVRFRWPSTTRTHWVEVVEGE